MCPCQNCTDRYPGCHDTCDGYQLWKAKRDAAMAQMRMENQFVRGRNMVAVDGTRGNGVISNNSNKHMYYYHFRFGKRRTR